jgi:hypothetical protein
MQLLAIFSRFRPNPLAGFVAGLLLTIIGGCPCTEEDCISAVTLEITPWVEDVELVPGTVVTITATQGATSLEFEAPCELDPRDELGTGVACTVLADGGESIGGLGTRGEGPDREVFFGFFEDQLPRPEDLQIRFPAGEVVAVQVVWGPNNETACQQPCRFLEDITAQRLR